MMEDQVVVRFAPSPTGYLHIGGARTAIFNWLYARKTGGKFILRIEDTDEQRSTENSIEGILDGLKWLGLFWDEGPNFQSANIENHIKAANELVENGHAYKCFCTQERIEASREQARANKLTYVYDGTCRKLTPDQVAENQKIKLPYVIRLKIPKNSGPKNLDSIVFEDAVYGVIEKKYTDIEDFVIVRSNGKPLYILSNTVDDIQDKVTHIIRGQDGLANTPKQILLYQALGAKIPVFAHMSLTLDPAKAKISKRRHGEMVAIHFYRQNGFLPWAFVNFLVLLGWATKESKEIFSKEELIQAFSLEGISRNNSVFNINQDDPKFFTDPKLLNMNAHYLRTLPLEELLPFVKKQLEDAGLWQNSFNTDKKEWFLNTMDLIRDRFYVLTDFISRGRAYFSEDYPMEQGSLEKNILKYPDLETQLPALAGKIQALDVCTAQTVETTIREFMGEHKIKAGVLINAIRVVLTGQSVGPDFIKSLICLGQNTVVDRLNKTPSYFSLN